LSVGANWVSIPDVNTTISNTYEKININDIIRRDVPMASLCTYHTGGKADMLASPASLGQIRAVLQYAMENNVKTTILGGGSNVLISDDGIEGLTILTSKLTSCHVRGTLFCAQTGLLLENAINVAIENSLSGLESLGGLPGTVGGAVWGNASTQGVMLSDLIEWVDYLEPDGSICRIHRYDQRFAYKQSPFMGSNYFIYEVVLRLLPNKNTSEARLQKEKSRRERLDSGQFDHPSAGCVFKNPRNKPAGMLIDEAGLKGRTVGGAKVSPSHGNFIINTEGKATSKDIRDLADIMQKEVMNRFGISLEREIVLIGRW
jgi:UDP-N-acetylmuramate dehydrogenase